MTEPTDQHREQAREADELIESPQRVWLHVYADADCWCCYHFDEDDDPRHLTEFVHVDTLSSRDSEIREVLERFKVGRLGNCWCDYGSLLNLHSKRCLATQALHAKLQPKESSDVTE